VLFKRLAADGITPKNTLFGVSADERDHEAAGNVGRADPESGWLQRRDGQRQSCQPGNYCSYASADFGEIDTNVTGLLSSETGNTTPFSMEDDTAPEFYLTGNPGPATPVVRTFEDDVARLTNPLNPCSGDTNEKDRQ
jgi:hypothetical protein